MTDELVGFEVAKLAKEKGFNLYNCLFWYHLDTKEKHCPGTGYYYQEKHLSKVVHTPTQSLLQRWLREKHGIDIWVQPIYFNKAIGSSEKTTYIINGTPSKEYDTYEHALEDALLRGLKLIKND